MSFIFFFFFFFFRVSVCVWLVACSRFFFLFHIFFFFWSLFLIWYLGTSCPGGWHHREDYRSGHRRWGCCRCVAWIGASSACPALLHHYTVHTHADSRVMAARWGICRHDGGLGNDGNLARGLETGIGDRDRRGIDFPDNDRSYFIDVFDELLNLSQATLPRICESSKFHGCWHDFWLLSILGRARLIVFCF